MADNHQRQRRPETHSPRPAGHNGYQNSARQNYGNPHRSYPSNPRSNTDRRPQIPYDQRSGPRNDYGYRSQPSHHSQLADPPMNRCPACQTKVPAGGLELHRRECAPTNSRV